MGAGEPHVGGATKATACSYRLILVAPVVPLFPPPRRKPVAEFVKEIQGLTAKDMSAAVNKLLKSAPSVAVSGAACCRFLHVLGCCLA